MVAQIEAICKCVNQYLLLQNLHSTRNCDILLEVPDYSDDTIRKTDSNLAESVIPPTGHNFAPGSFRCKEVWEMPFLLHPRLKTGPDRSGISRGIKALHGVLNRFSVYNRSNMFVYQEKDGNVFYIRLHERTNEGKPLQGKLSESDEKLVVSRSSSVVSLSQTKSQSSDQNSFILSSRPRVRSFGEKEFNILNKSEGSIILKVHGISEVGPEIKHDLVQVLQNRLDDAVLEVLSVMLARNPMCKLSPAEVHFIQKPFKSPETTFRIPISQNCLNHLQALGQYLKQNILQFLNVPKYTDHRPHYHFQDYSQPEGSKKRVPESNIFLYNQNHASGSRGIVCTSMAIVNAKGDLIAQEDGVDPEKRLPNDYPRKRDFEKILSLSIYEGSMESEAKAVIEFKMWKQGRINIESLKEKLKVAVRQSIWDLVTEFNFLPTKLEIPLTSEDLSLTCSYSSTCSSSDETNNAKADFSESGEKRVLHPMYHSTLSDWFQCALEIAVPSVKKHVVDIKQRHSLPTTIRELQTLIRCHLPDLEVKTYVHKQRQPFLRKYKRNENEERALDDENKDKVYVPYIFEKHEKKVCVSGIVIAKNVESDSLAKGEI